MGEQKFTPGPWVASHSTLPDGCSFVHIQAEAGDVTYLSLHPRHVIANGYLIAAAPEMFEALKACHKFLVKQAPNNDPLLDLIDAALAKAEGRPSPERDGGR